LNSIEIGDSVGIIIVGSLVGSGVGNAVGKGVGNAVGHIGMQIHDGTVVGE
jgi:hypothetical protein